MTKAKACDILILGTGSLAQELVGVLSMTTYCHFEICIAGRDEEKASMLALIGNSRARMAGSKTVFSASVVKWTDVGLASLLGKQAPKIVVHLSSLQSPWQLSVKSEWSSLVKKFGFGITAPLQMHLLMKLARVVKKEFPETVILNGCYPDVCNALLAMTGFEVLSGVGNVAILEAVLRQCYQLNGDDSINIIGHHFHVGQLISRRVSDPLAYPQVLINGKKVDRLPEKLSRVRLPSDASLNSITALTMVPLLHCLATNKEGNFNLPGPLGLPGGYPVLIRGGRAELSLPDGWTFQKALHRNIALSSREGIAWTGNSIYLDARVIRYLKENHSGLEVFNTMDFLAA